ncbi:MAG: hypothetical protein AUG51_10590 [Acidobacteria bacterium 13_1_20CM_3_53_8]|nr:MAG: hypothetical protein AUG51_10590 [Acidobacteria bacterium 13_1_20CM_3_53_8]
MENETSRGHEQEFEERFEWRKARQIENLKELSEFAQSGGGASLKEFPGLKRSLDNDDSKDALQWSIIMLWCEAAECYIFGEFQSCILTCGAIVERCLKLEYEEANGTLPSGSHWTLGRCIRECRGIVSQGVLDLAQSMLEPRNNRAHALLEHSDPDLAISGGAERGIEIFSSKHYHIEPYRGDARRVILSTYKILSMLYGSPRRV